MGNLEVDLKCSWVYNGIRDERDNKKQLGEAGSYSS